MPDTTPRKETVAQWFGLNRATVAVLVVIGCLGLSEEIWTNFLGFHLKDLALVASPHAALLEAVMLTGIISFAKNLLEGVGYIVGGTIAHRMGPRVALAVSAAPMTVGFIAMLSTSSPWGIVI